MGMKNKFSKATKGISAAAANPLAAARNPLPVAKSAADTVSWAADQKMAGANQLLEGKNPFGPGATRGDKITWTDEQERIVKEQERLGNIARLNAIPQLENRIGSETLGDSGQFKASTIAQSPWQDMAMQKQGVDLAFAGDALAKTSALQAAQNRIGTLGRKGGGGMAEGAGLANFQNMAQGRQGLASQGGDQRMAIAQQAGAKGLDTAQFNMGQVQQADKANIAQSIKNIDQQNAFNRLKYGEQMKYKAGQETGNAMENAKGGKK